MRLSKSDNRNRNREALISATRVMTAKHGMDVSLSSIAGAADLTTGAIYSIFGSKQDLMWAVLDSDTHSLVDQVQGNCHESMTLREVLRVFAEVWTTASDDQSVMDQWESEVMLARYRDPTTAERLRVGRAATTEALARLLDNRVIDRAQPEQRTDQATALKVATAVRALLTGLFVQDALSSRAHVAFAIEACECLAGLTVSDGLS